MKNNKAPFSYEVLHEADEHRIIDAHAGIRKKPKLSVLLTSILLFVITTWAAVFLGYDYFYPHVSGSIKLHNLPYYFGLLGAWMLYTINYSYLFLKRLQPYIYGRVSSVGAGLMIQSFIYLVVGCAIAFKSLRSEGSTDLLSLLTLRIPLIDNPSNTLVLTAFLFIFGAVICILSLGAKTYSGKEKVDRLMMLFAAAGVYAFTLAYNVITHGWLNEFILTSGLFTAIIMIGIVPYVYANAIFCGAKASKPLRKTYYSSLFGGLYFALLFASYRLSKDLFVIMHEHDSIDFANYSLLFVFAVLATAFTRTLMYPRLIEEYNSDVLQTKRINSSNKGLMEEDDYIPDDDDFEDGLEADDFEDSTESEKKPSRKKPSKKKEEPLYEEDYAISTDNDIDGIMEE